MCLRKALISFFHLLIVFCLYALAFFLFCLPFHSDWQLSLMEIIQSDSRWIAGCAMGVALLLQWVFFHHGRGSFLRFRVAPHMMTIDSALLKQAVEECFHKQLAAPVNAVDISISSRQKLEIAVEIAMADSSEVQPEIERLLTDLLVKRFGYRKSFTLSIHHSF